MSLVVKDLVMREVRRMGAALVFGVLPFVHSCESPTAGNRAAGYLWRAPLFDSIVGWTGRPAILNGTVFLETRNTVLALDLSTGATRWQTVVRQASAPAAANIVAAGTAVFIAEVGSVVSLDASTGTTRWRFVPDAPTDNAQSAVDDHALYVGTRSHKVYALDPSTGQPRWTTDIGPTWPFLAIVTGLTVSGDTVYAAAYRLINATGDSTVGVIAGLDRNTGAILFTYQAPQSVAASSVTSAPVVSDRLLLASDLGGAFYALDRFTLREIWRVRTQPGFFGPFARPSIVGNRVYIGTNDTYVYSTDLATGKVLWQTTTKGSIHESAVCGQRIFANNLGIFVLDLTTGHVLKTLFDDDPNEIPTSGFAVAGDRVVFSGWHGAYALSCQ